MQEIMLHPGEADSHAQSNPPMELKVRVVLLHGVLLQTEE